MNPIFRKNTLQVNIILLLGWSLLLTRAAIVWGDELNEGRQLYLEHCAACHELKGTGTDRWNTNSRRPRRICGCSPGNTESSSC